jgi:cytochrome b-561 domain-containing protein 2
MSNAILIMADNNFLATNLSHQDRITAHWIVQVSAVILILIAQTCIFMNKVNHEKAHFQSTHAVFGLITVLLTIATTFGGIFTKYSYSLRNIIKPAVSKVFHSLFGITAYVLAIITIILGFNQMWNKDSDAYVKPLIIVLLIIAGLYVIIKSLILLSSRVKDLLSR